MKLTVASSLLAACLLGSLCAPSAGLKAAADEHPIAKVIKLIETLQGEVKAEGKTEAGAHVKFERWCAASLKTLSTAIDTGKENGVQLKSKIKAGKMQRESLQAEIQDLKEDIERYERKVSKAETKREAGEKLFNNDTTDLKGNIEAMGTALKAIKGSKDSKGSKDLTFLQTSKASDDSDDVSPEASDGTSFLAADNAERPDLKDKAAKVKHVQPYKFKSGNVHQLLGGLKSMFEKQLDDTEERETIAVTQYTKQKKTRDALIEAAKYSKGEKESALSSVGADIVQWGTDLGSSNADLKADENTKAATEQTCETRAREWEQRCSVRDEEMKAMAEAISILDKAGGVKTGPPENPALPASPAASAAAAAASFLQLESQSANPRQKVLDLLRQTAQTTHSKALEQFAEQLALRTNGPFDQVNNMIEKMIFRLMDDQQEEDKQKNWCDHEIKKTDDSEEDKNGKVGDLKEKLEDAKARLQELTAEIETADKMVADLTTFMKEAVDVRKIGKDENAKALKEAKDAQAAIAEATAVLKEFYDKEGDGSSFLQRSDAPVSLEDPDDAPPEYKGTPKSSDVITLLKTTASKFAKMEADTRAQESTDQLKFDQDMKTSKVEKARRAKESETKGVEKSGLVDKIGMLEKNRKTVQGELDMVKQYEKDLKPACIEGASSYEKRKADRKREEDALRKSQDILADAFKEQKKENKFLQERNLAVKK